MNTLKARLAIFMNVSLPMRFAYAVDRGHCDIACCIEAALHYREIRSEKEFSRIDRARCFANGFTIGLFSKIPDWFIDSWFLEADN